MLFDLSLSRLPDHLSPAPHERDRPSFVWLDSVSTLTLSTFFVLGLLPRHPRSCSRRGVSFFLRSLCPRFRRDLPFSYSGLLLGYGGPPWYNLPRWVPVPAGDPPHTFWKRPLSFLEQDHRFWPLLLMARAAPPALPHLAVMLVARDTHGLRTVSCGASPRLGEGDINDCLRSSVARSLTLTWCTLERGCGLVTCCLVPARAVAFLYRGGEGARYRFSAPQGQGYEWLFDGLPRRGLALLYRWGEGKDAAAGRSYTLGPEMGDTAAEYAQRWWYVCKRTGGVGGNLDLRGRWLWKTLSGFALYGVYARLRQRIFF